MTLPPPIAGRALVTGAKGLIGSALLRRLGAAGAPLTERCTPGNGLAIARLIRRRRPTVIFHCAGSTRPGPRKLLAEAHVNSTVSLLFAVRQTGPRYPRIIVVGSAAEYGLVPASCQPIREDQPPHPVTDYGWSKARQTVVAKAYADQGVPVIVARIFNILDRDLPASFATTSFRRWLARAARRPGTVARLGNLDAVRDFVTLDEVCEALLALARRGKTGEVYNICSGRGTSMRAIWKAMASGVSVAVREEKVPTRSKVLKSVGSPAKIFRHTGWRATSDAVAAAKGLR